MPTLLFRETYMQEQQLLLSGLHCAACVRRVEKVLSKVENVTFASVNLADQTAFVQGNVESKALINAITKIGFGAELLESEEIRREKQQAQMQQTLTQKKKQAFLALTIGTLLMLYGMIFGMSSSIENQSIWFVWALISLVVMYYTGKDFFVGAYTALKNKTATMDTLIALSTSVAWLYSFGLTLFPRQHSHLYYEASIMIIGFISLGKYLELKAKQRSSLALEKLLDLAPKQAVILEGESAKTIPVKGIKAEMRVQALTGDRLPVDGMLESGHLWVDESMLTGEALPVEKHLGDLLRAGTIVTDGAGVFRATQVGNQTALARIISAVRHAQSSKPPLAQWVDKIAAVFVPVVVSIAVLSAFIWLILGKDFAFALAIFTTVLIIACPCALGLAIPLSTIAGVARSAEYGVLVRNIDALQASSEIDTLVFDKTGTLTMGEMWVEHFTVFDSTDHQFVLQLAKSLEQQSSHPIAQAIVQYAEKVAALDITQIQVHKGLGISGIWHNEEVKIGNAKFVGFQGEVSTTHTQVFLAKSDKIIALWNIADQLRSESKLLIQQFKQQGYHCVMLTGDRQENAEYFAEQLHLDKVISEVLPEQKATEIMKLQAEGKKVAMIGDGINDAPALMQANVGIAMHKGSDIALESADLSLMKSGLQPIADILPFSKQVLRNMKQSLVGAFIYNVISIPIAAGVLYPFTGWLLNPMIAAIAMAMSSITVVLNSQRLLK